MTATLPWGHFTCILITNPQNNPEKKYHCLHLELRKQNNWLTFPSPTTSERQHHLTCQRCLVFMCWAELVPICGEWFEISKLLVSLLKTPSHFLGSSNWMYWLHIDSERSLSSVQFSRSVVSDSLWPHGLQHTKLPCPSPTNSWSLLKLMSIESVMPSNHLILCRPLLLWPSVLPSIRVFSNESVFHIRWPKDWIFSFSISPSNEYSGLISFRNDWLDLLAVQGTLKSLLQHHCSKASILWHSAFFIVQLPHPYMTTGKTIALTRWTFVTKVTSLLFNMLFRFVSKFPRDLLVQSKGGARIPA